MLHQVGNITVRLPVEKQKKIEAIAVSLDRSRNWIINEAIERYLEVYSWQETQIEKRLESSRQGTAKHASHENVSEWLASWGAKDEQAPPSCE